MAVGLSRLNSFRSFIPSTKASFKRILSFKSSPGATPPPKTPLAPQPLDSILVVNPPYTEPSPMTAAIASSPPKIVANVVVNPPKNEPAPPPSAVVTTTVSAAPTDGQEQESKRVGKIFYVVLIFLCSTVSMFSANVPPYVKSHLALHLVDGGLLILGFFTPASFVVYSIFYPAKLEPPEVKKMALLISFIPLALDFLLRHVVGYYAF